MIPGGLPTDNSPWGIVDYWTQLAHDIWSVSTPGHGGLYVGDVSASYLPAEVQDCMDGPPWFEEDCEAVIVVALLWDRLNPHAVASTWSSMTRERALALAENTASYFESYAPCLPFLRAAHSVPTA